LTVKGKKKKTVGESYYANTETADEKTQKKREGGKIYEGRGGARMTTHKNDVGNERGVSQRKHRRVKRKGQTKGDWFKSRAPWEERNSQKSRGGERGGQ